MKKILAGLHLPEEIVRRYSDEFIIEHPAAQPGRFSNEELAEKLSDASGYLGGFLNKELIDKAEKLEIACSFGAGYDGIDHKYAGEKGIWVMNAPHGTTEPTAELTITILLCLSRRILNFNRLLRKTGQVGGISAFVDAFDDAPSPTPVHGKTLGIVGFGKIGKAVGKKAKGLGMDVIYYDVFRAPEETEKELGVTFVSFEELLKTADYVTLHCMYTPENHHLMDAEQFKLMKPTAYFINAGRGGLMNEKALIDALNDKQILGAALDVFEFEPKVSPELFEMDSVLLTPHIGTGTYESRRSMAIEALDGITAQLKGGTSPTIVNREFFKAK
ncbi:MAG: NAD(P)-dependent oxidoreductase [Christensenellales bacterium]|jgi:lactate dehydrogenase-like 2-hydroxyacid dehydrogenase